VENLIKNKEIEKYKEGVSQAISDIGSGQFIKKIDEKSFDLNKKNIEDYKNLFLLKKKIQENFEEPKKLAYQAHKSVCALEKKIIDPIDEKSEILSEQIIQFDNLLERKIKQIMDKSESSKTYSLTKLDQTCLNANQEIKFEESFDVEVKNMRKIIKSVLEGVLPIECISLNSSETKKFVKKNMNLVKVPGLEVIEIKKISNRGVR
jgi:hypothetical protein